MAGTTPKGFRFPQDADAPNIAVDIKNLADDVDAELDDYIAKSIVTAQGDLITASGSAIPTRLGIGAEGRVLYSNGTAISWAVDPTSDVVTTAGDLIYGTGADAVARLGIGTANQVLAVNSGATAPEWVTPAAGGKVLQVVSATFSTTETTNSSTFSDTAFTLNITPSAATSKVLVLAHSKILGVSNSAERGIFRLRRDTTDLITSGTRGGVPDAPSNASPAIHSQWSCAFLDSPNTTLATTYLLRKAVALTTATNTFGDTGSGTQITLIEIGV